MIRFLFTFILIGGITSISHGQELDCSEVRLDTNGLSMSKLRVYDQKPTGLCYAYTASQMIDAWRFSHGDQDFTHLTSPYALAVQASVLENKSRFDDIDAGFVGNGILAIKKYGSCNDSVVREKMGTSNIQDFFYPLLNWYKAYQDNAHVQDGDEGMSGYFGDRLQQILTGQSKTQKFDIDPRQVARALREPTYTKYLQGLFTPMCQGITKQISSFPNYNQFRSSKYTKEERFKKFPKLISERLAKPNAQPVGIDYCNDNLFLHKNAGINDKGEKDEKCKILHASVIIGKRPGVNGTCEFLIRNSFGESCYQFGDYEVRCQNGQIWVEQEALMNNIFGLEWLGEDG